MEAYLILILLVLIAWAPGIANADCVRFSFCASFVVLFFFMAFRAASVGVDTQNYMNIFVRGGGRSLSEALGNIGSAPLYDCYSWFLFKLCDSPQAILIMNSAVVCIGFGLFIYRIAGNKFIATLLFIATHSYFFAFNGMRQSVAISLVLVGVVFLLSGKKFSCLLFFIAALGVHNTSAFCIILMVAGFVIVRKTAISPGAVFIGIIALSACLMAFYHVLVNAFAYIFPRYQMYIANSSMEVDYLTRNQGRQVYLYIVFALVAIAELLVFGEKRTRSIVFSSDAAMTVFVGASIAIGLGLFCSSYDLFSRLIYYFLPFLCCFTADAVSNLDKEYRTLLFRGGVLSVLSVVGVYMLFSNYGHVVPYVLA